MYVGVHLDEEWFAEHVGLLCNKYRAIGHWILYALSLKRDDSIDLYRAVTV